MTTATITDEGHVTIPRSIREHLHLSAGDQLGFTVETDGRVVITPAAAFSDIHQLRGLLHRPDQEPVSVEEMDARVEGEGGQESATGDPDTDGRLARLERQGAIRRAAAPMPTEILRQRPPAARRGNALEALLAERDEGR